MQPILLSSIEQPYCRIITVSCRRREVKHVANLVVDYRKNTGRDPDDTTTFILSQQDWDEERDKRPAILFKLHRPQNFPVVEPGFLFTPFPHPSFSVLAVVVDITNQPLRNFPEIPIKISTDVEGWLLEAWSRLNPALTHVDILQRMPYLDPEELTDDEKLKNAKNRLGGRRRDFRQKGRCISWELNTSHKSKFDKIIFDQMSDDPDSVQYGSTRKLADLTLAQRQAIRLGQNPFNTPAPVIPDNILEAGKYLRRGNDLIQWLASHRVQYVPSHKLTVETATGDDDYQAALDCRFTAPASNDDKQQLMLALFNTLFGITKRFPCLPFLVSLASYADGYNSIQDQLVHAAFLCSPLSDLGQEAASCGRLEGWRGGMINWDEQFGLVDEQGQPLSREKREELKSNMVPCTMSPAFMEKLSFTAPTNEAGEWEWPETLVVQGRREENQVGWIMELQDFL
jgi:hypothetical protein